MEASRDHCPFGTRWPCTTSPAMGRALPDEAAPPRLSLVRTEPTEPSMWENEQEKAGAHRLLAAMVASRAKP